MNPLISSKKYEGVFFRESKRRLHNGRPDRNYIICYSHQRKKFWRTVGWTSMGVTAETAYLVRIDILRKIKLGQLIVKSANDLTVDQAVEHYLAWLELENKSFLPSRSLYNRWIKPHCGDLPLNLLDHVVLEELKRKAAARLHNGGMYRLFSFFRAVIYHAIKKRLWHGTNPLSRAGGVSIPPPGEACERFLTPEEAKLLLARLKTMSPLWHDMALVSLHTGLRLTELFKLKGQDIDESNQLCRLTAKGGAREVMALTPESLEVLLRRRDQPADIIFRQPDGKLLKSARGAFAQAVDACGFNNGVTGNRHKVWFHTLRHTFASWLAQSGVDIYAIMKLMRHKNIEMTQRYAHLIPERQREHLAVIRQFLPSGLK